jgi:hypothetical protein
MEMSGQLHVPASLPPGKEPVTHWIGGWGGPRAVLDAAVKRKIHSPRRESNPRTPIVQPVVTVICIYENDIWGGMNLVCVKNGCITSDILDHKSQQYQTKRFPAETIHNPSLLLILKVKIFI